MEWKYVNRFDWMRLVEALPTVTEHYDYCYCIAWFIGVNYIGKKEKETTNGKIVAFIGQKYIVR